MDRLSRSLARNYLRYARRIPSHGLLCQLTPNPRAENQRHLQFSTNEMDAAILKTLLGDWPNLLQSAKASLYRRIMSKKEFLDLIRRCFREGDKSCLDFAINNISTVSELVAIAKTTSLTTTDGIRVICSTVASPAPPNNKSDSKLHHVYFYRIVVENISSKVVQLLARSWVFSCSGAEDQVLARWQPGVIGETPVLAPGDSFVYMSSAGISSAEGGTMRGAFNMLQCEENKKFEVEVGETRLLPTKALF